MLWLASTRYFDTSSDCVVCMPCKLHYYRSFCSIIFLSVRIVVAECICTFGFCFSDFFFYSNLSLYSLGLHFFKQGMYREGEGHYCWANIVYQQHALSNDISEKNRRSWAGMWAGLDKSPGLNFCPCTSLLGCLAFESNWAQAVRFLENIVNWHVD